VQLPEGEYRAFIYDCDGTLVDSMGLHFRAWRQALVQAGARFDFDWSLFCSRAGMALDRTVMALNEQFGERLEPELVVRLQREAFHLYMADLATIPEVVAHARRIADPARQCVASGGERQVVERALDVVGIRDLFSFVVCAADVERGKPDPDMFLLCAERLGVPPKNCLVFEDAELGIQAAVAAGMGYVRVEPRMAPLLTEVLGSKGRAGIPGG
jgi:HAD superfamily hydrolase (TIGR01509 family)